MRIGLTILFLWVLSANATNYYVANAGSNSNNGTSSATPFQTIAKVVSVVAKHDSVFLNRGDNWNEKITVPFDSLYFGAYGTGNKPLINGYQTLTMNSLGSNLYSATATNAMNGLNNVMIGGSIRAKGRFPASSYNTAVYYTQNYVVSDQHLTATYTGGEVVIRTRNFLTDVSRITSQNGDTLFLSPALTYVPAGRVNFFIQNLPSLCTTQNNWAYNDTTKKITVYSSTAPTVQYSSIDTTVYLQNKTGVTFDNIDIQGSNSKAIRADTCNYITIKNVKLSNNGLDGIYSRESKYLSIKKDTVFYTNNDAVVIARHCTHANLDSIWVKSSGIIEGLAASGNVAGEGIYSDGDSCYLTNSRVDSTGYNGIGIGGGYSDTLYRNYVTNVCVSKDDGGGIYITGDIPVDRTSVKSCIVVNSIGIAAGAPTYYLDNNAFNVNIDSCTGNGGNLYAVEFHLAAHINFKNSTIVETTGIPFEIASGGNGNYLNIKNTVWYGKDTTQPVWWVPDTNLGNNTIDSNFTFRQFKESKEFQAVNTSNNYSLSEWRTATGWDAHTSGIPTGVTATGTLYINPTLSDSTLTFTGRKVDARGKVYFSNTAITIHPFQSVVLFDLPSNYPKKIGAFLFN